MPEWLVYSREEETAGAASLRKKKGGINSAERGGLWSTYQTKDSVNGEI